MSKLFKKNQQGYFEILRTLLAIIGSLVIVFIIILLASKQPLEAISDFLIGPLTSFRRMGNVVEAMVPLIFTGLAVTVLYRAGLFNLAMEGAFFIGCVAAAACALILQLPPVMTLCCAFLCAAIAGSITTTIPGVLKVKMQANELVTSLMLNYVCLHVGLFIITQYFYDPQMNATYSRMFDKAMFLPRIIPGTRINIGIFFAAIACVIVWLILDKSVFGYRVKVVGNNAKFAKYAGLKQDSLIIYSQALGGALAGLGGAIELFGMYKRFQFDGLPGFGWDGVLIAILARFEVKYVPLATLFLAYIRTGAQIMAMQTDLPFEIIKIIQAVIIVLISAQALLSKFKQKQLLKQVSLPSQAKEA